MFVLSASGNITQRRDEGRAATNLMPVQSDSLAVDLPVRIAFDDLAVAMPRLGATTWVADAGERLTHHVALRGCYGRYFATVTGGVA